MFSPRLFAFMMVSMIGHAAVLVPLSGYLPALFDVEEIKSDTVIVSISVVSHAETEEQSDTSESSLLLSKSSRLSHVNPQHTEQHSTQAEAFTETAMQATSQQPTPAAPEPAPVEEPTIEKKDPPPLVTKQERFDTVTRLDKRLEQSDELEARRHRQLRAEERYLAELLNAIAKHRFYPKIARKKGHQGSVEIELTIHRSGEFESVKIGKPSNYHSLNKATTRALNRLKRFKPFPSDIQRDSWHISIPFRYVLNANGGNRS